MDGSKADRPRDRTEQLRWAPRSNPEPAIWPLRTQIEALVDLSRRAEAHELLTRLEALYEDKALNFQDDAWRGVARWLIEHGRARLWRRLYRKLGRYHGLWNWGQPRPEEPWVIAYGEAWAEGHEKLVRLTPARVPQSASSPAIAGGTRRSGSG